MNTISKEKLTAYALEELSETERAELEAFLSNSDADRQYADDTKEFCQLLQSNIGAKDGGGLTEIQREEIAKTLPFAATTPRRRWPVYIFGASVAAAVAVMLAKPYFQQPDERRLTRGEPSVSADKNVDATLGLSYRTAGADLADGSTSNTPAKKTVDGELSFLAADGITVTDPQNGETQKTLAATGTMRSDAIEFETAGAGRKPQEQPASRPLVAATPPAAPDTVDLYARRNSYDLVAPIPGPARGVESKYAEVDGIAPASQPQGIPAPEVAVKMKMGTTRYVVPERVDSLQIAQKTPAPSAEPLSAASDSKALADAAKPMTAAGGISGSPVPGKVEAFGGTTLGTVAGQPVTVNDSDGKLGDLTKNKAALAVDGPATQAPILLSRLAPTDSRFREGKPVMESLAESRSKEQEVDHYFYEQAPAPQPSDPSATAPASALAESYVAPAENPFKSVAAEPLSTFSIDVDTASYANVRRFLNMGQRPPAEAVRLEELVNYFRYAYPTPAADKPCSITAELVNCPWNETHRLARIGLKAKVDEKRPQANLVFLLDVSGSMDEPNKLPLVKQSLNLLVDKLAENDRVSIVVYAGASGLVLPPTSGENKKVILGAIENLKPGGSTNGASGITLAYEEARKGFIKEGVNRVILATDGDFNVGVSDREGLQTLIEKEAKSGVFLSVLGYGMGNLKDSTMEVLADKGNGNYAYIDSLGEARKVLAEEMSSTLVTVAKDVKLQIEFNPSKVRSYKLLGYENRMLAKEDFNDDKKDAGEMGAGHTVTALYEIVPSDAPMDVPAVDKLKYQAQPVVTAAPAAPVADSPETMTVKLRYKAPDADVSQLMEMSVTDQHTALAAAPKDFKFATAVAGYAMLLKGSKNHGTLNWNMVRQLAKEGKGEDPEGYRGEFMQLLEKAAGLAP